MKKVILMAEATGRDILRRRGVIALLVVLPLAFYLTRHDESPGQAIRFACLGLAWAVSTAALFAANTAKPVEPRLRLAGYGSTHIYTGRLIALTGLGTIIAAAYSVLVTVDLDVRRPWVVAVALLLTTLISAPLGLLIGALVPRDLEGMLILIILIGVQMLIDPAKSYTKIFPLWSSRELLTYAVDPVSSSFLRSGLAHGLGVTVGLTLGASWFLAWRLRRRKHLVMRSSTVGQQV